MHACACCRFLDVAGLNEFAALFESYHMVGPAHQELTLPCKQAGSRREMQGHLSAVFDAGADSVFTSRAHQQAWDSCLAGPVVTSRWQRRCLTGSVSVRPWKMQDIWCMMSSNQHRTWDDACPHTHPAMQAHVFVCKHIPAFLCYFNLPHIDDVCQKNRFCFGPQIG